MFLYAMETQQQFRFAARQAAIGNQLIHIGTALRQPDGMPIRLLIRIAQLYLVLPLMQTPDSLFHGREMFTQTYRAGAKGGDILLKSLYGSLPLPLAS